MKNKVKPLFFLFFLLFIQKPLALGIQPNDISFNATFILPNSLPWQNAQIRFICRADYELGPFLIDKVLSTNLNGTASTTFSSTQCPLGSIYLISYEPHPGCNSRTVCYGDGFIVENLKHSGKIDNENVNALFEMLGDPNLIPQQAVPEFTAITGLITLASSVGFLQLRNLLTKTSENGKNTIL